MFLRGGYGLVQRNRGIRAVDAERGLNEEMDGAWWAEKIYQVSPVSGRKRPCSVMADPYVTSTKGPRLSGTGGTYTASLRRSRNDQRVAGQCLVEQSRRKENWKNTKRRVSGRWASFISVARRWSALLW